MGGGQPGSRLGITGEHGRILVASPGGGTTFQFIELETSAGELCRTSFAASVHPPMKHETIDGEDVGGHGNVIANFADAVLDHKPLSAPAEQGRGSVELPNAMIMSGLEGHKIDLPIDRQTYEAVLQRLIEEAKAK